MEIRYKIESMEETGFSYKPDFNYNGIDIGTMSYQFVYNLTPNADKGELALSMTVQITPEKSDVVLAQEDIYAVFKIDPFDKVISINADGFSTKEHQLIDTFVSVAIGAIRGLLVKNLKGTSLAKSVMPLIPMNIISKHYAQNAENK